MSEGMARRVTATEIQQTENELASLMQDKAETRYSGVTALHDLGYEVCKRRGE